jgi:hypothetical protein
MLENLSAWLRREQRLATATPDDVPKGGTAAASRHLSERFTYFLRNQDDEGEFARDVTCTFILTVCRETEF